MSCTLKHAIQSCDTGQQLPYFDSGQMTITWMSTIKLNTDYTCPEHLADDVWSLQGNLACSAANQSARTIIAI